MSITGATLYLDTEFNGHGGELISMALLWRPSQGAPALSWYAAKNFAGPVDAWVATNVIPVINVVPLSGSEFLDSFHSWIKQFNNPHIICDWPVDAAHLLNALAGKEFASSLYIDCHISVLVTPTGQPVSKQPHNAFYDAWALMEWHERIKND